MAAVPGFPKWLEGCKGSVTKTREWEKFLGDLQDAVQQQLIESRVTDFTALSETEKQLFLQRATQAIQGGKSYGDLFKRVSLSLDQHMSDDIAEHLLEDYPSDTKSEMILDHAQDGAVALLRKWPEMKSKLRACLNRSLPDTLRKVSWRLFLNNGPVRKHYLDILSTNPRTAISPQDLEISQKCEQLLSSPLYELKGSIGAFYAMKAVLSFHHASMKTSDSLSDIDFLLVIPFVYLASPGISRTQPASGKIVALLVEEFLTFMDSRPGFVADSGSEQDSEDLKSFCVATADNIIAASPGLVDVITDKFTQSEEKIVQTDASKRTLLEEGVKTLCRPLIRSLFVGYLNMDTTMFVWDQYMLGVDAPGFHDHVLPVFAAVLLILLQDKLKTVDSPAAMETVIRNESPKLKQGQFQYWINRYFYKDLAVTLMKEDKASLPVLDPTQADYPPWTHWHREAIPFRTRHQDRKLAREERDAERERQKQLAQDEEDKQRDIENKYRREEEERVRKQADEQLKRKANEKSLLQKQLEEEKQKRKQAEMEAKDEIERLKLQLEALRLKPQVRPGSTISAISEISQISNYLVPPPPTRASQTVSLAPTRRTPTPAHGKKAQANAAILDFLKKVRESFNKVAHGEGQEEESLNDETKDLIRLHRQDVKAAELEVFGHYLKPGDFDKLSADEQKNSSEKMMEVMKKRFNDRQKNSLTAGGMV